MSSRQATFQVYQDEKKEWRWRLVAPNGRIIAVSGEGYQRHAKALAGIESLCKYTKKVILENL